MWGFTLELRWRQINVLKMTLDIWYLKIIVMKFRKSMSSDSTSVVICHLAENRFCFLRVRSTAVYMHKGKTGVFENGTVPEAHCLAQGEAIWTLTPGLWKGLVFQVSSIWIQSLKWWGSSSVISTGASTSNISLCKIWNTDKEFNLKSYLLLFILQLDKPQCERWPWHRVVHFKIFILLPSGVVTFKPVTK